MERKARQIHKIDIRLYRTASIEESFMGISVPAVREKIKIANLWYIPQNA